MKQMMLGEKIKARRLELGLTQIELAIKVGLSSDTTISKVESNARGIPLKKLKRYADALNVSMEYLIGDNRAFEDFIPSPDEYENDKRTSEALDGTLRGISAVLTNSERKMVIEYAQHLYRSRNEKKE